MRTFKLLLAYDGTGYSGWQIQPNGRSIQQELHEAAVRVMGGCSVPVASGRTDAGVHALGQVVTLRADSRLSADVLARALNALLPDQIAVLEATEVDGSFDVVRDAKWKHYRYVIHDGPVKQLFLRSYCWQVRRRLDVEAMRRAAGYLVGEHDFRCFETEWPNRATSVRTVRRCQANRFADFIYLDVEADGFLYNMVRAIAGTLYEVGRGRWPANCVGEMMDKGQRALAGPTAPARGLFLVHVTY